MGRERLMEQWERGIGVVSWELKSYSMDIRHYAAKSGKHVMKEKQSERHRHRKDHWRWLALGHTVPQCLLPQRVDHLKVNKTGAIPVWRPNLSRRYKGL